MGATAMVQTSVGTAGSMSASNAPQKVKSENADYTFSNDTTFTVSSKSGARITYFTHCYLRLRIYGESSGSNHKRF